MGKKWKYLAIEIRGKIFVMNDNDELGGLIDNDVHIRLLVTYAPMNVIQHAYVTVKVRVPVKS